MSTSCKRSFQSIRRTLNASAGGVRGIALQTQWLVEMAQIELNIHMNYLARVGKRGAWIIENYSRTHNSSMNDLTIARAIHIVSVVIWMGGVTFVTLVLIPTLRRTSFRVDQLAIFNAIENRFANIAREMVLLAGISGFYMIYKLNAWNRFTEIQYFWMHAMVFVWALFCLALFIVEPFFLKNHGKLVKDGHNITNLQKTQIVHAIILLLSLVTIIASVLGAHGFFY